MALSDAAARGAIPPTPAIVIARGAVALLAASDTGVYEKKKIVFVFVKKIIIPLIFKLSKICCGIEIMSSIGSCWIC